MLVITRLTNEAIELVDVVTGTRTTLKVTRVVGDRVRISIDAPDRVVVHRSEFTLESRARFEAAARKRCGLSAKVSEVEVDRKESNEA